MPNKNNVSSKSNGVEHMNIVSSPIHACFPYIQTDAAKERYKRYLRQLNKAQSILIENLRNISHCNGEVAHKNDAVIVNFKTKAEALPAENVEDDSMAAILGQDLLELLSKAESHTSSKKTKKLKGSSGKKDAALSQCPEICNPTYPEIPK